MNNQRPYNSPLREKQAEQTKDLILDALVDLIGDVGADDLSIKDLAARAGVAERTVYRHFADRQALRDGLSGRLAERSQWPSPSHFASVADLIPALAETFRAYDRFRGESRAVVLMNLDPARTIQDSRNHVREVRDLVAGDYPRLSEADVAGVGALLNLLVSSRTWLRMLDGHDLPGEVSAKYLTWVARLVLDEIEAGNSIPELPIAVSDTATRRPNVVDPRDHPGAPLTGA